MATPQKGTKKTSSRSTAATARSKSTTNNKKNTKTTGTNSTSSAKKQQQSFFTILKETPAGMALIYAIGVVLFLTLDLLLSLNSFDTFFLLLGIELVVFLCIRWLLFALKNKKKSRIEN